MQSILLVEDDRKIARVVKAYLEGPASGSFILKKAGTRWMRR